MARVNKFGIAFVIIQIKFCLHVCAQSNNSRYCYSNNNNKSFNESVAEKRSSYNKNETKLSPWCIPTTLDTEIEPWQFKDKDNLSLPWNYHFTFNILEVEEVNDKMQTISIAMYFRIKWMEPRLEINHHSEDWNKTDWADGGLSYPAAILDKLWYPDLEIDGIERFKTQTLLKEMSNAQIYKSRHVRYGIRVKVIISCEMSFENYPLDRQNCPFRVHSYFSTEKTISCTSEFTYTDQHQRRLQYLISINPLPEAQRTFIGSFGNFSVCGFEVSLVRERLQTVGQVYLTSILFVLVSWVSFLISPDVIPGRIGLLVTIFLVLVNIFDGAKSLAPFSKNLNAIDLYILFCIFLVFLALLEYAFILAREKLNRGRIEDIRSILEKTNSSTNHVQAIVKCNQCCFKMELDTVALIIFPIVFIIFNITYWVLYA